MPTDAHQRVETEEMSWTPTEDPGLAEKRLGEARGRSASLWRVTAGTTLPSTNGGRELYVIAGALEQDGVALPVGTHLREPASPRPIAAGPAGCTLFVALRPSDPSERNATLTPSNAQPWLPGQGGLRVKPLHSHLGESTALVHWPAGERFVAHRHFGGEEILVLSGTFEDEHGSYPSGTWLQSPHLSQHHPFVREETVIWVKTGHLAPR